jgi:hypothetical protein
MPVSSSPAALRDTLLRLAEPPRLYTPRWSEEIIAETGQDLGIDPSKSTI